MKAKNGFIKNLRYLCLISIIALGLITIVGCNGGNGDGTTTTTPPEVNTPPTATITSPSDGSTYTQGDAISFSGTGEDAEDGTLTGSSLVWTSSIDGQIGTGSAFTKSDLSVGTHTVTLTATDSDGATGSDSVSIESVEEAQYVVEVYDPDKAYPGTTFFTDSSGDPRVVEVDMNGNVIWEYYLTQEMIPQGAIVGFDAELLPNDHIILTISNTGLFEIDREGNILWSYLDPDVSHDADLLANGNILYVFGNNDGVDDAAVKEVNRDGEIVWEWHLKNHYLERFPPEVYAWEGWGHCNAVQRLSDGTTMVSIRNFWLTTIVDSGGNIVREYDWSSYGECNPHEPQIYEDDGTMIVSLQIDSPYAAVKIDLETGLELWTYPAEGLRTTRDCNILPNGNVLLTTVDTGGTADYVEDDISTLIEVTPDGEIVWQLKLAGIPVGRKPGWFFKAERIPQDFLWK